MSDIGINLETLESTLKWVDAPVLKLLNPGLQVDEIVNVFLENDIPAHADLFALYRWHNGLTSIYGRSESLTSFSPLGAFPNLTEMIALRKDFLRYDYFELDNRHEYVPFLSSGEDDMHLLRVSDGKVYHSSPRIQIYCEPVFRSITSMLGFIIDCYRQKALRIDPIDGLIVEELYWKISNDFNRY